MNPIEKCSVSVFLVAAWCLVAALGSYVASANGLNYGLDSIVAIEHQPDGFLVETSESNFGIILPSVFCKGKISKWITVSVNEESVLLLSKDRKLKTTTVDQMNPKLRSYIFSVRSNFTRNLKGLDLKDSSESELYESPTDNYGEVSSSIGPGYQNQATYTSNKLPPAPYSGASSTGYQYQSSVSSVASSSSSSSSSYSTSTNNGSPIVTVQNSGSYQPKQQQYIASPTVVTSKSSYNSYPPVYAYHNLEKSPLNRSLAGDVYQLDGLSNLYEIYSTTVSVRRKPGSCILYRDHRYFGYSNQDLPLQINSLFLFGDFVVFVYHDGYVSVKASDMLNSIEVELVVGVRNQLKDIAKWQEKAAELVAEPEVKETTSLDSDYDGDDQDKEEQ